MRKLRCTDCGLLYSKFGLDNHLPRAQWITIHPKDSGVLCANCVVFRMKKKLKGVTVVHMIAEVSVPNRKPRRKS